MPVHPRCDWSRLESLVHRDPAQRGIARCQINGHFLDHGQLALAAQSLAESASTVGIVTGFAIVGAANVAAETDGPPGALYLARALLGQGADVVLLSDCYGVPLLEAGCDLLGWDRSMIEEFPVEDASSWMGGFLERGRGRGLSHLVAIERPGPSHTLESMAAQARAGPAPRDEFLRDVPPEDRDSCHNMRGARIDDCAGNIHRLFERADAQGRIVTIGLGDGGNEIGMGKFAWESLRAAIPGGQGGKIACRIPARYSLIAGVSNWAAYALAIGACAIAGKLEHVAPCDIESERALIEHIVRETGAVDGVTRLHEATVDGLPLETYLQALAGIRLACGLPA